METSIMTTKKEWRIISNPLRLNLGTENNNIPLKKVDETDDLVHLKVEDIDIKLRRCTSGGMYQKNGEHNDLDVFVNGEMLNVASVNTITDIDDNKILKITFR